nr:5-(carboxyamino)imidazole ribonucleotide synthase [Sulfobacillus harzensis]
MGGGQLGRMMALAGRAMGLHTVVWDPSPRPAGEAADAAIARSFDNSQALAEFLEQVQHVTYEFENVNVETVRAINEVRPVFPPPELLYISQNRLREKDTARRLGLLTTPYGALDTESDVRRAAAEIGFPAIIKTAEGGYDGKGQEPVSSLDEALAAFKSLQGGTRPLIFEQRVAFEREVSVVVARDQAGLTVTYPVTENHHAHGILDYSLAPAPMDETLAFEVRQQARTMAAGLDLVGVMALEFFIDQDGRVLFNEMAPRPHNSGHWTIEGATPSQFTQHMRAVAGWPVVEPRLMLPSAMVNLMGESFMNGYQDVYRVLNVPGAALHWYGKTEMRPGRKVGHVTLVANTVEEAFDGVKAVKQLVRGTSSGA